MNKMNADLTDIHYWAEKLRRALKELSPESRLRILTMLGEGYCRFCGNDQLPCHCENDE